MERIQAARTVTGLAVPRSGESTAALAPSSGRLNGAEITQLDLLLEQTAAFYPHQEESEQTAEVYRNAFKILAERHGIDNLRTALLALQLRPGQKFFPHPSEVSEELEAMATKVRAAARAQNPYVPDPTCNHISSDGMAWVTDKDGDRVLGRCKCWERWKSQQPVRDNKSTVAAA